MRYYMIAGEASGDLHGANLMKAIRSLDTSADFRVWGGNLMEKEGGANVKHIRERAFMGFVEVVLNLANIRRLIRLAKEDIVVYKPDRLIFIDYPGFNLRVASWAHEQGIETHYYISPKVWAWNTKRALKIKRIIDHLYVILPFEVDFYKTFDYEVHYVGNPLMDAIESFTPDKEFLSKNHLAGKPVIALLPGSRKQEIDAVLPVMLESIECLSTQYNIVVAVAPNFDLDYFDRFNKIKQVKLLAGNTYDLLSVCDAAIVTSGTATLETALMNVPQVVCYKTSLINYALAKKLIKVKFISLVNLIMNREIVRELIQNDLTPKNLENELNRILKADKRLHILKSYDDLRRVVGPAGASMRVAEFIVNS